MVASFVLIWIIFLRASTPALRMASGTSLALPRPTPTNPLPSPTTTSALKCRFFPPLTTFTTRARETSFSFKLSSPASTFALIEGNLFTAFIYLSLKFQTFFAGSISQGFDPAMILITTPVKDNLLDTMFHGALCNECSHQVGGLCLFLSLDFIPQCHIAAAGRGQRTTGQGIGPLC